MSKPAVQTAHVLQSLVPRGFELKDPGFSAYAGFLRLECFYGNPIIVGVISAQHALTLCS